MVRVSVIGCGNMGGALVRGLAQAGHRELTVYDIDPDALASVASLAVTTTDPAETRDADVVFVAVKPRLVADVLHDLDLSSEQTLVSVAAGVNTAFLADHTDATIVRVMPNLAAEMGSMAAAVTGEEIPDEVRRLLEDIGVVVEVNETEMDAATAVNGSGPAFVFYLIRALAAAGVEAGLEPTDARVLAAQTFKGAAETVLQSDDGIDELIEAVCSPRGTTIEGIGVLRRSDVEESIVAAVLAAEKRATELAAEVEHE